MPKIVDLIQQQEADGLRWFSLEFFPYKTCDGVHNLFDRVERLKDLNPLFTDITWGAGGSTADLSLEIAAVLQNYFCVETQMHLTCTNMEKQMFIEALRKCKERNIQNILALRGDPPKGQDTWTATDADFKQAVDLVRFIRTEYGNDLGICVAGYPEGHAEAVSYEQDLIYLKEKIDAGADVIITQLFYDVDRFLKFVVDCRAMGIQCPIIPGIMPVTTHQGLKRIIQMCRPSVPQNFLNAIEAAQDDDNAVLEIGTRYLTEMCGKIFLSGISGIHIYTMNQEKAPILLLESLKMLQDGCNRLLPWRPAILPSRCKEDVRPIFWANRPKSYLLRTQSWDRFPAGRWGDRRPDMFAEPGNWTNVPAPNDLADRYKDMWGHELTSTADVVRVFTNFIRGEVKMLPWNEVPMRDESSVIHQDLLRVNEEGFLTINSQPQLNGVPSDHPAFGWGQRGGRVYQKAYLEGFMSPTKLQGLLERAENFPMTSVYAISRNGDIQASKWFRPTVNAVTWGIFPHSEVLQPTVMDSQCFHAQDEAFQLWEGWLNLYPLSCNNRRQRLCRR
eukprot:c9245_g1_i2.p2 GENE.c9245_g1_i2~~c9245_g1_i2.p2  ORF type:complete len:580 (+),score=130.56 c9245_g1_i2:62-1741(+)